MVNPSVSLLIRPKRPSFHPFLLVHFTSPFSIKRAYYVALSLVEKSEVGECSTGDGRTHLWKKVW